MKKKYTKKMLKAMDNFQWYDYSFLVNFLKMYFKETSKMYKKYGIFNCYEKISEDMNKVYKMLEYADNYNSLNCHPSRLKAIRNGELFRPGKDAYSILKQKREIYKYIFNFIGRHITTWWN